MCGSVRSESCTPLQCEAGDLCPPEGTLSCEKEKNCAGALPLSNRANSDVNDVKNRLDKLTAKMTKAANMVQCSSLLILCCMSRYIPAKYFILTGYILGM